MFVHGKQTPSLLSLYRLFVVFDLYVLLIPYVASFVEESKMSRRARYHVEVMVVLLVAEHGLDHLTTTNGEDGEERITQLWNGTSVRIS
jgi:hypothetical protein